VAEPAGDLAAGAGADACTRAAQQPLILIKDH
jgi:hypothetical protein